MQEPKPESIERSFELERVVFFSDAVYAIAITLLALELKVPELEIQNTSELLRGVLAEWPRFLAFALSFWIIAIYWLAHHRYFRHIMRYDERLIALNFLMLFFLVLIPFTTLVLGEYGDFAGGVWLYAVDMLCLGLSSGWLWHHASAQRRLVRADMDARLVRHMQLRALTTPLAAVIVILLSFVLGGYASFGWFLIFPLQALLARRYRVTP
jgi:uncharacterized membrane protein